MENHCECYWKQWRSLSVNFQLNSIFNLTYYSLGRVLFFFFFFFLPVFVIWEYRLCSPQGEDSNVLLELTLSHMCQQWLQEVMKISAWHFWIFASTKTHLPLFSWFSTENWAVLNFLISLFIFYIWHKLKHAMWLLITYI